MKKEYNFRHIEKDKYDFGKTKVILDLELISIRSLLQ